MTVPFVDLFVQYRNLQKEIDHATASVIAESGFIRGTAVDAFESAFAQTICIKNVRGVASGTDALHLAVRALNIGPGDEVITQTNTWISTAFAASYTGAKPVLVDIDPNTYQMDIASLEKAITPHTKAVIPVHMFGHPAPMDEIVELCRPRGIRIIEDIAQAPLAELSGRQVGSFGDIACYSFYPSKNLGCLGDGGAVATHDDDLAEKIRHLADYGQTERYRHEIIGYNSRLDTLQAAVLLAKLPYLRDWTEARRTRAAYYEELLKGLPVKVPMQAPGAKAVYHLYVVQVERRDACLAYLRDNGVMVQVHYPAPVHFQPCYRNLGYKKGDLPVAEAACGRILSLPMYPELTDNQIRTVVETLKAFFETT